MKKQTMFFSALFLCALSSWGVNIQGGSAPPVSCDVPTNVQVPNATTTTTTAKATWTPSTITPTPDWYYEYGPAGFAHGAGIGGIQYINLPFVDINGLTPGTEYDFYVSTFCGIGDSSLWVKKTFRTHYFGCPAGSTPEAEVCGGSTNDGCNLPVPAFEPITCGETKCGTGFYNGGSRDSDWYLFTLTQKTDVTWSGRAEFSFLLGFITSPCPSAAWIAYDTSAAGTIVAVNARLNAGTYYAFAAPQFEELVVCDSLDHYYATLTCNTCLSPGLSTLTATNITGTTADLGWTAGSTETAWEYVIGLAPMSFPTGAGVPTILNPTPVSELLESSTYCYYVRSSCSGTFGRWTGPFCFSTLCDPSNLPHCEPFAIDAILPPCWTSTYSGGVTTDCWSITASNKALGTVPNEATCNWTNQTGIVRMITGAYNTTGLSSVHLAFRQRYDDMSLGNDVSIMVQSSPDGLTWTTQWTHAAGTGSSIPAELKELDIPVTGSTVYFAWTVDGNLFDINYWYVDDICVSSSAGTKTLNLKLFLEGLYNTGTGLMNQAQGLSGPEFGPGIADKVKVELHNPTPPFGIAYTYSNMDLHTNGTLAINTIPGSITGSYYVVIKHRNSIETWSKLGGIPFGGPSPINYDFSTAASQAYGNNMKQMGSVYAIWGGDVNQDGIVDSGDQNSVENASTLAISGYVVEDVNGDGIVDSGDQNLVENNSTLGVQVMTP